MIPLCLTKVPPGLRIKRSVPGPLVGMTDQRLVSWFGPVSVAHLAVFSGFGFLCFTGNI